ncbi:FAD-dependent oxidoreductase [Eubacteriales bacterium OttesenSCG-928-N13]|nr:FAD-dependent oxidoreductase [Eubacteriales bacterium OttesenSCG-928-N13]
MYDVMIVGGGPAGMTAALYAARAGMKLLLLEGELIGGQASTTNRIENFPGFPGGTGGPELMMQFDAQLGQMDVYPQYEQVRELSLLGDVKKAVTKAGSYEARTVILAMGAARRRLGIPGEEQLNGRGISYCATCDGALYAGKRVAVVGGGHSAVEDTLYLAQRSDVLLIHRRDQLRAVSEDAQVALSHPRVQTAWNEQVISVDKNADGLLLTLQNSLDGAKHTELVSALFVAVGTDPKSDLIKDQVALTKDGYVQANEDTITSVPGVFVAGDLRAKPLKQVVTAVADGAVAATMTARYIIGG